jgi:hypothetical protein
MEPTERTYHELKLAYDTFNARLFEGRLPTCLITLQREKRTCGYFSSKRFGTRQGETTDEIALNPEFFAVTPLIETLQTIVHEMVHLWQAHFGKPGRGRYHNAEWANKMEAVGLMPSSTGQPGGKRVGDCMADYAIAGGKFTQVVEQLLTEHGFAITWYDLHTAPAPPYPAASTAALNLPAAALQVPADHGVTVTPKLPAAGATNRSNRLKYSCGTCSLNVWGKPGLRLACLGCNVELEADDDE